MLVAQLIFGFFIMSKFSGGPGAGKAGVQANSTVVAAAATPTPAPASSSGPSLFDMMQGKGLKTVLPELQRYEEHRMRALQAAAANPLTASQGLTNLWPPGTPFTLAIYLSDSAEPLSEFPSWDDAPLVGEGAEDQQQHRQLVQAAMAKAQSQRRSPWQTLKDATRSDANLLQLFAAEPLIVYPNATFSGLSDVEKEEETKAATTAVDAAASQGDLNLGVSPFPLAVKKHKPGRPLWLKRGLRFDSSLRENHREQSFNISLPASIRANPNATVWAHCLFVVEGSHPDPGSPHYSARNVFSFVHPLTKHLKKRPARKARNLLSGTSSGSDDEEKEREEEEQKLDKEERKKRREKEEEEEAAATAAALAAANSTTLPYWRPTLHLQLVADWNRYPARGVPPPMNAAIVVLPSTTSPSSSSPMAGYYPVAQSNEFWLLSSDLLPINATTKELPLTVSFSIQSQMVWTIQSQMAMSWSMQEAMGSAREGDNDLVKGLLLESNPILLFVTMVVSVLHMVFDMLAFRNEITFWKGKQSLEGISVRGMLLNLGFSAVIFLYLWESGETSWMILMSQGVGLAIEVWKLRRVFKIAIEWPSAADAQEGDNDGIFSSITRRLPKIRLGNSDDDGGYTSSGTRDHDKTATDHLQLAILPLILGYALYSLFYDKHRSWLGWILGSLTSFVYAFGFVQMAVPQLYVNYKLKSVAAMNWKSMSYKFLGTIVDDLAVFLIKSPTLHKIAVFRDDVVFVLYLLQRWLYPIDPTRVNEYGQRGDGGSQPQQQQQQRRIAATATAGGAGAGMTAAATPRVAKRSKYDRQ